MKNQISRLGKLKSFLFPNYFLAKQKQVLSNQLNPCVTTRCSSPDFCRVVVKVDQATGSTYTCQKWIGQPDLPIFEPTQPVLCTSVRQSRPVIRKLLDTFLCLSAFFSIVNLPLLKIKGPTYQWCVLDWKCSNRWETNTLCLCCSFSLLKW